MHLVLIGLRGSGKTTAGRSTANLLHRPFIDLDDRASAVCGVDPATCFATRGEEAWREAEASALLEALAEPTPSIIALGGGTPTAPGAEQALDAARAEGIARIVWLDAAPDVLAARIAHDQARPPLTDLDPLAEMKEIDARRRPLFERLADEQLDTGSDPPDRVVGGLVSIATRA